MNIDWEIVSDRELNKELARRRDIIDGMIDLSQIPIEYLISESERRRLKKEQALKELAEWKPEEQGELAYNAIKTPDGALLFSRHRHDYVTHTDSKTGGHYSVDGGFDYIRRGYDVKDYEELSIYSNEPLDPNIRTKFHWGNRGKNGDQPLKYKRMKDMSNSHIQAILDNVFGEKENIYKEWFERELEYRKENNIVIED